jgi:hypothetical protein
MRVSAALARLRQADRDEMQHARRMSLSRIESSEPVNIAGCRGQETRNAVRARMLVGLSPTLVGDWSLGSCTMSSPDLVVSVAGCDNQTPSGGQPAKVRLRSEQKREQYGGKFV